MRHWGIGIDTARYGHHVSFLREDKQPAAPPLAITESRAGYEQLQQRLEQLHHKFPAAQLHLRIDAAGQYAANLERFVRSLTHLPLTVSVGEPKRNKDYHRAHSPKRKSDASESLAMARYAVVERPAASHGKPPEFAVLRRVASRLQSQTKQTTRLTNQRHETLAGSFPELATLINDLTAGWVLQLLEKYPTAQRVAAARLSSIRQTPFIPEDMAEKIHQSAQQSVGTLAGAVAEALIGKLVGELRDSLAEEKSWRELLVTACDALPDGPHRQIATINGIGQQTAAALIATAVDVQRFETASHLIGYYGIFPEELQSGVDKLGRPIPAGKKSMCRKGNDLVRGLLWQCAKCASAANGGNPAVRALYARRLAKGDSPQTAWGYCMTKLLRQVFGVWTSNQPFDPKHEATAAAEAADQPSPADDSQADDSSDQTQLLDEAPQGCLCDAPGSQQVTAIPEVTTVPNEPRKTGASSLKADEQPNHQEVIEAPAPLEPVAAANVAAANVTAAATDSAGDATSTSRRPIHYAALREQIPLLRVLEQVTRSSISTVQHRGPCPLHEPTATSGRQFSANLKRQVFRCFAPTCQAQGSVLDFWRAYRKLDLYEAAIDLAKTFGIEVPYLDIQPPKQRKSPHKKTSGHHPPSA